MIVPRSVLLALTLLAGSASAQVSEKGDLYVFMQQGCAPCKSLNNALIPVWDSLSKRYRIRLVHYEEYKEFTEKSGVDGFPYIMDSYGRRWEDGYQEGDIQAILSYFTGPARHGTPQPHRKRKDQQQPQPQQTPPPQAPPPPSEDAPPVPNPATPAPAPVPAPKPEKGDKGDKGDAGAKGDKGDVGDKGDKGDKGEAGQNGQDAVVDYAKIVAEVLQQIQGQLDALSGKRANDVPGGSGTGAGSNPSSPSGAPSASGSSSPGSNTDQSGAANGGVSNEVTQRLANLEALVNSLVQGQPTGDGSTSGAAPQGQPANPTGGTASGATQPEAQPTDYLLYFTAKGVARVQGTDALARNLRKQGKRIRIIVLDPTKISDDHIKDVPFVHILPSDEEVIGVDGVTRVLSTWKD